MRHGATIRIKPPKHYARKTNVVEMITLVREDGTAEAVRAEPGLVTPPTIKTRPEQGVLTAEMVDQAIREVNAMLDRWSFSR